MFNCWRKKNICFKFRNVLTKQIQTFVKDKKLEVNTISPNSKTLEDFINLSKHNCMYILLNNCSIEEEEADLFIKKYNLNVFSYLFYEEKNSDIKLILKEKNIQIYVNENGLNYL